MGPRPRAASIHRPARGRVRLGPGVDEDCDEVMPTSSRPTACCVSATQDESQTHLTPANQADPAPSIRSPARRSGRCQVGGERLVREIVAGEGESSHGRTSSRSVFCTRTGTALSAGNVRRDFRAVLDSAGLVGKEWTPRELRHSFVSLLSAHDVPIENISRLVGHTNTVVTETVYRKQIRPVIQDGAIAMNEIFPADSEA
ncbi:tyrosine-type recombinase/integrase [Actinoallomurus sp. NPDC052274]|uniref:tyrosine-type recombinase/integrase n=1 Tax=Actinoallomurus sp. NPDC052274 TaxID=3155420 RepID=UPI0034332C13